MASKRALARLNAAIRKSRARNKAQERAATDRDLKFLTERIDMATRVRFDATLAKRMYAGSGPDKPTVVAIDIDEQCAYAAAHYTWNSTQRVERYRGGTVRVTFKCDDFAPVIAWVLRYGSHAKVVKPPALIEAVVKQLDATFHSYAEQYESAPRGRKR